MSKNLIKNNFFLTFEFWLNSFVCNHIDLDIQRQFKKEIINVYFLNPVS